MKGDVRPLLQCEMTLFYKWGYNDNHLCCVTKVTSRLSVKH